MLKICERLKPFLMLARQICGEPGEQGLAAGARGVKGVGSPCQEGAGAGAGGPGEDAGISSLSLCHGTQPRRAAGAPWRGVPGSSGSGGAAKAVRGMFSFYAPLVSSIREEPCTLPQLPSPSLELSAFVPLLGTWPRDVPPEPRRDGQEHAVLPAASR